MTSIPKEKTKLPVDDLEDWKKDIKNKEDENEEGEVFYLSKPILMKKNYAWVQKKQYENDDFVAHEDGVAAKLVSKIRNKELEIMKNELALTSYLYSARSHISDEEEAGLDEKWIIIW